MKASSLATCTVILGLPWAVLPAVASQDSLVTAVYSRVTNGYARAKMPDGSFKREFYAIANGSYSPGASRDQSIDRVPFPAIAGLVAEHLARQNYFLAPDAKTADLLLVISWGTTIPFNDGATRNAQDRLIAAVNQVNSSNNNVGTSSTNVEGIQSAGQAVADAARNELTGQLLKSQMFTDMRAKADERNARILGYVQEINERNDNSRFAGGGTYFNDLISDIEEERYYVIVAAYDFRAATRESKRKLLWATRVSISAQGNRFNESLASMLSNASRSFGQDTGRLLRRYQQGKVGIGELKVIGIVPDSSRSDTTDEKK